MVAIPSSTGGFVNVEIKGVAEAVKLIRDKGKDIVDGKDAKTLQATNFLQQEIQESITGNRVEIKRVDTGNYANSITIDKIKNLNYIIYTDVDYAKAVEYGTFKMDAGYHWRNTLARNKEKVIQIIKSK